MVWPKPEFSDQYSSRVPLIGPVLFGLLRFVWGVPAVKVHGVSSVSGCASGSSARRPGCALTHRSTMWGFIGTSREAAQTTNHIPDTGIVPSPLLKGSSWKMCSASPVSGFPALTHSVDRERRWKRGCPIWSAVELQLRPSVIGRVQPAGLSLAGSCFKTRDTHIPSHLFPPAYQHLTKTNEVLVDSNSGVWDFRFSLSFTRALRTCFLAKACTYNWYVNGALNQQYDVAWFTDLVTLWSPTPLNHLLQVESLYFLANSVNALTEHTGVHSELCLKLFWLFVLVKGTFFFSVVATVDVSAMFRVL